MLTLLIPLTLPRHSSLLVFAVFKVLQIAPSVCIDLMPECFCLMLNTGVSVSMNPFENVSYEFSIAFSAVPSMF